MQMRVIINTVGVAMFIVLSCGTTPTIADDDQWIFRQTLGSGNDKPTAIFLSWDYGTVLFRATCDRSTHELVPEYFGDGAIPLTASDDLGIHGTGTAMLSTQLVNGALRGEINADLLLAVFDADNLEIDAPNEMGEPWHVGRAEPLRRLTRLCQKS
jgi:hypothetical protein